MSPLGDASADLVFPASGAGRFTSMDDDSVSPTQIHSIRFDGVGYALTGMPGQEIRLGTDIIANNTSGVNAIQINISLTAADHTMMVAGDGVLDVIKGVYDGGVGSTLFKAGPGELVFTATNNTYANNTEVTGGTFSALGADGAGNYLVSRMIVDEGATLVVANSAVGSLSDGPTGGGSVIFTGPGGGISFGYDNTSTVFRGVISGPGGITKYGSGTQTLSGHNMYGIGTGIAGGTLRLGIDNALPCGTSVSLSPGLGCTLDLANYNVTIAALGEGDGTNTVNLGTGTLTIDATGPNPLSYNGVITGTGNLVKDGTATQGLGGDNNYTGSTTIMGGNLEVDGNNNNWPQSAVTVEAGAVLSGTGTVGPTTVFGTLQPGSLANPTGTLTVAGDVTNLGHVLLDFTSVLNVSGDYMQGSGATLEIQLGGIGQSGQMNIAGNAYLDGTLTLTPVNGYTPTTGDAFQILTFASRNGTDFASPPAGFNEVFDDVNGTLTVVAQ
jgi:autotransporter-associated beta strand protein